MPASEPGRNHIMVPVLELRDISKGYADGRGVRTEVLKSINLSVGSGEFVAILGFSGTGKRSEEPTSELQSLMRISYAVFSSKTTNHHHSTPNTPRVSIPS